MNKYPLVGLLISLKNVCTKLKIIMIEMVKKKANEIQVGME